MTTAALGLLTLMGLAACSSGASSSSGGGGAGSTGGGATAATGGAAVTNALGGAAAGQLDVSKQCAAIKASDVAALFKSDPGTMTIQPLECDWPGDVLKVSLWLDNPDKYYGDQTKGGTTTPLPGVGDQAVWFQPVPDHTMPWVVARKGSVTCEVLPPDDPTTTTIAYSGTAPIFTIAAADAAAWAQKQAAICQDVFSVG
jgi:hypothetical protein